MDNLQDNAEMRRGGQRGESLVGMMNRIIGEPILTHSRRQDLVWGRAMVAYQLITEGYSSTDIGGILEKDHATILHYKKMMSNALAYPKMFGDVTDTWDKFKKVLEYED